MAWTIPLLRLRNKWTLFQSMTILPFVRARRYVVVVVLHVVVLVVGPCVGPTPTIFRGLGHVLRLSSLLLLSPRCFHRGVAGISVLQAST